MAGLVTLLFKKIKQPVVLGYLLAGFLVGPEVSFLPTVQEKEAITIWAEIGVIVLLFGLGLEFSFKKLFAVGRGASITAITKVLFMLGAGYATGQIFGWSQMDSLFLGGILSISSTTIIIRAFDELGFRQKGFVNLVFGILVVEDLVAVLLLVLLSTIAVTNSFQGTELIVSAGKLAFFLSIWFLGGIFLVPWFLQKTRSLMNDETTLIVSLALCLTMVILATHAGFSPALGAFIMGSILAETPDGEKIEHNLKSVKNLFSAIFFVSVGMLIDIDPLKEHWAAFVVITLITIFGKFLSTTIGALIGGQSIKTSIQSGMSLVPIGEFSFIIATLGLSLGVISSYLYPLAVAVSAITTLTTPYMIKSSEPFYNWIYKHLPDRIKYRASDDLSKSVIATKTSSTTSEIARLFLNTILVIAIALATNKWLTPILQNYFENKVLIEVLAAFVALLLSLPSLWAIISGPSALKLNTYRIEDIKNLTTQALLALFARIIISLFLLSFVIGQFISALLTFVIVANVALVVGFLGAKNFSQVYQWLEKRFTSHLNEKDKSKVIAREKAENIPPLAPWDAHLSKLTVQPNSSFVGLRLSEISVREKFGVTIAMIERGTKQILAPKRDDFVMAHDRLVAIGTDDQLLGFAQALATEPEPTKDHSPINYGLYSLLVDDSSPYLGKTIRDSGLRESVDGLVVGIERENERLLNPDSTVTIQNSDLLWIVGVMK